MQQKDKRFISGLILKRENITNDLWKIWIQPESHFSFDPGQYCTIGYEGIERPYSIASSPKEDLLELFIELIPKPIGNLTPLLYELPEGTEVTLRKRSKGIFQFQTKYTNHIMVSTVTGVVPFVSMIRTMDLKKNSDYKLWIFEGASYINEFGYSEELALAGKNKNIKFIPTCSRPDDPKNKNWEGVVGRVNEVFGSVFKEINNANKENTIIYACGHPDMVSDVSNKFSNRYSFIEEKFWKP